MKNKFLFAVTMLLVMTMGAKAQDLLLHFDFSTQSGSYVTDVSSSSVRGTLASGATVEQMGDYYVLNLGTSNGYFDMTSAAGDAFISTDDYTISVYYYVSSSASLSGNGYFLWTFSTSSACTSSAGVYSAYRLNAQRIATSTGGYSNETGYSVGSASAQGKWVHVAYTQSGTTGKLYIDGALQATISSMPLNSTNFGTTAPSYCWLGRAPFSDDNYLASTRVADFRLYDAALSDSEVATLAAETESLTQAMNYGTAGDATALAQLIAEAQALLDDSSSSYMPGAEENLRDAVLMAENAIAASGSDYLLAEYEDMLSESIQLLKATEGMSFDAGSIAEAYDADRGFIHPGGLHTQADFDRVKAQLEAGNETVTEAWNLLKEADYSQSSVATYPVETIIRGGGTGENYINAARGATMAYQNALRWKIAGTEANAKAAVRILNAWAQTTTSVSGNSNYALAAGIYGYQFAQAAELVRDYEGWEAEDFEAFRQWMLSVWYTPAISFMRARNGTWENSSTWWQAPGHYWSNWGLCNALCLVSIGVLCDDVFIYNQGVSYLKHDQTGNWKDDSTYEGTIYGDGLNEFWGYFIPSVSEDERGAYGKLGQLQESGRDQGHATMSLGLAVDCAQTLWNQGNDLYHYMDDRLAAGIEWTAAYNNALIDDLPWRDFHYYTSGYYWTDSRSTLMTAPSSSSRGQTRNYWGRVIGHYEGVMGVEMPYSEMALSQMGIDVGGTGSTSGAYDHLGYTVLMETRDSIAAPEDVPTLLTPLIVVDGETLEQAELGGLENTYVTNNATCVAAGTTLTLSPQLPDGEEDTGNWTWNSGETTREISVTANRSYIYRATYTNANGVQSQQAFSIAVDGDSNPSSAYGQITYDGATYTADSLDIYYGDRATLTLVGSGGYGTYEWDNGSEGSSLTTTPIVRPRTITGVYVNQSGTRTPVTFTLGVKYMQVQTVVNGEALADSTEVTVNEGDRVEIGVYVPDALGGCSFSWDSGENSSTITWESADETAERTLTYNVNGEEGTITFTVRVASANDYYVEPGNYLIYNRETDTYLTSVKSATQATFNERETDATSLQQVWQLTQNPADSTDCYSYNLQCLGDSLYLASTGRSSKLTPDYVYSFQNSLGTDYLEVHNDTQYWSWNVKNSRLVVTSKTAPSTFPFQLIPYDSADGVGSLPAETSTDDAPYYNLNGTRAQPKRRGIYIQKGKKLIFNY